jgi:hypothetical protein
MEKGDEVASAGSEASNPAIAGFLHGDNGDSFKSFPKRWGAGSNRANVPVCAESDRLMPMALDSR